MRHCSEDQVDQGEVLDNCYHITFALRTFCSKNHVITEILRFILFIMNLNILIMQNKKKFNIINIYINNFFCYFQD